MREHPHEEDALGFLRKFGERVEVRRKLIVPDRDLSDLLIATETRSGLRKGNRLLCIAMDNTLHNTFYDDMKPALRRKIARAIKGAGRIVDLGCGNCDLAFFLAESNRQEVIGVDISEANFPHEAGARKTESGTVRCVKEDARTLCFLKADSVDAVVSVWALHEMSSPLSVLREARRILRPGGQMLIVDFPRDSLAQRLWNEDYYSRNEVGDMLWKARFVAVRCRVIARGQIIWADARKGETAGRRRFSVK